MDGEQRCTKGEQNGGDNMTYAYEGETLEVRSFGGKRGFTVNLGNFFPASVKKMYQLVETIRDYEDDYERRSDHVLKMIHWLEGQIQELKNQLRDNMDKGMVNVKEANKIAKLAEKYSKNIDRLKAAAKKYHIDIEEV